MTKAVPTSVIDELVLTATEVAQARRGLAKTGSATTVRSRRKIPSTTRIRTFAGAELELRHFTADKHRVYCPFHADNAPSAFVGTTRRGMPFLFCSTCQASFFPDGAAAAEKSGYEDYNWDGIFNVGIQDYLDHYDEANNVSISEVRGLRISRLCERFLPDAEPLPAVIPNNQHAALPGFDYAGVADLGPGLYVDKGVILIKSPKGTGKTELLAGRVTRLKTAGATVLLLSHRRSLLTALSKRLALTNYLDGNGAWQIPTGAYSVCMDSLTKLKPARDKYNVVVIDECEQVFEHLLSSTMADNRREVIIYLQHYLRAARQIVLLDADLGKLTLDAMVELTKGQDRKVDVTVNQWQPPASTVYLYDDPFPHQLVGDLVRALERGERCYVCSNSKRDVELLASHVPRHVQGRTLRSLAITAENSQTPEIQRFIERIATEILNYDVLFTSPSISTGVDITIPGGGQGIDVVFGLFRPLLTTHLEMDQQLARVRNCKRIRVWITKEEFNFETDPDVIKAEILASEATHRSLVGIDECGQPKYHVDELYDTIFATVTAKQRRSKNRLRCHYVEYKKATGWNVEIAPYDTELASLGARVLNAARKDRVAAEREQLKAAETIDRQRYEALRRLEQFSTVDAALATQMRRYEIEAFYCQAVDDQLLAFDERGRRREAVRNFTALVSTDEQVRQMDSWEESELVPDRRQWAYRKQVLSRVLHAAGLLDASGAFQKSAVDAGGLGPFVNALEAEKAALQRLFDVSIRRDAAKKPVRQLSKVLEVIGLKLVRAGRDQSGDKERITYRLDEDALKWMLRIVLRRVSRVRQPGEAPD